MKSSIFILMFILSSTIFAQTNNSRETKGELTARKIIAYDSGIAELIAVEFKINKKMYKIDGSIDQEIICKAFKYKHLVKAGQLASGATGGGIQRRVIINSKGSINSPKDLILDESNKGQFVWGRIQCLK